MVVVVVDKKCHAPPGRWVALVGDNTLATVHFNRSLRELRRARKPRVQPPRARRPGATSRAHVLITADAEVGAPGLTQTRPSGPNIVTHGGGTDGTTPVRRQPLPGRAGGFGEVGTKKSARQESNRLTAGISQ